MDETPGRRIGLRRDEPVAAAPALPTTPPPYAGLNTYASDPVLAACLDAVMDEPAEDELTALGAYWGSAEAQEVARIANATPPTLRRSDFDGRPIHKVELHPAFHALLNRSTVTGLTSAAWEEGAERRQHRMRAAALYLAAQCERGHLAAISSTHAAVAALAYAPALEAEIFPQIASRRYDRRPIAPAEKEGIAIALAVGEYAGGGDRPDGGMRAEGGSGFAGPDALAVTGEKTFVCHPGADYILVLTRTLDGPTAALVPRYAPENAGAIRVSDLIQQSGFASLPVATVSFRGATARLVGEPGRGLQVLRDVRTLTQLDASVVAAGAMRAALTRAVHHARYHASGGQPLMADGLHARILADLALESAAHTALTSRIAAAFDQAFDSDSDHAFARIVTPAARLYALKAAPMVAAEAAECIGVQASVADHPIARIRADLSALAQWEGTAQEAATETAQLLSRDPTVLGNALDEIATDLGEPNLDLVEDLRDLALRTGEDAALSRAFAEQLAMIAAGAALRRTQPRAVADAYITTRLRERQRLAFGALDTPLDAPALIDFIAPED